MTRIIAVHGFMYDPGNEGGINDPKEFFDAMEEVTGREVRGFSYYSVPFGIKKDKLCFTLYQTARAWLGSWVRGYLHPYRYAWALADEAAIRLAEEILMADGEVDIICHSLGSRVVAQALHYVGYRKVHRVVIFNGAELVRNTKGLANEKVLNICVRSDNVLGWLGSRFSGDKNGPTVGQYGVPGWNNIFLDDPDTIANLHQRYGWTVQGDNPNSILDHWYSYRFDGNHALVRAWFEGRTINAA